MIDVRAITRAREGENGMSDKLNAALTNLEKARTTALEVAIAERAYRLCVVLDADGRIQRSIDRARRMVAPKDKVKKAKRAA
jgi:hypothetical protein